MKNKIKIKINKVKFWISSKKSKAVLGKIKCVSHPELISLGHKVRIKDGIRIEQYEKFGGELYKPHVNIKENVIIGYNFTALVSDELVIEKDTIIASDVLIVTHNHGIDPENDLPYYSQKLTTSPVYIGKGCWIGEKVSILPGVHIGEKCVVGAGSVVTKSIPPFSIAVGIPAKIIKMYSLESHNWIKI